MAWIKIPAENHQLFYDALPKDKRVTTLKMFGGVAAKTKGQMFAGLFARSICAKLSTDDQQLALAIDGSEPFDPLGNKRVMNHTILLGEEVMEDPTVLRDWLRRAFVFTSTLPEKKKRPASKATSAKSKRTATKPAAAAARAKPKTATRAKPTRSKAATKRRRPSR